MNDTGDVNFYCSAYVGNVMASAPLCGIAGVCLRECQCYHHKWPTPEQFKKEYGKECLDDGAVYFFDLSDDEFPDWQVCKYKDCMHFSSNILIVCACTPFGKPSANWRP